MDKQLGQRLLGAAVVTAAAIIIVPELLQPLPPSSLLQPPPQEGSPLPAVAEPEVAAPITAPPLSSDPGVATLTIGLPEPEPRDRGARAAPPTADPLVNDPLANDPLASPYALEESSPEAESTTIIVDANGRAIAPPAPANVPTSPSVAVVAGRAFGRQGGDAPPPDLTAVDELLEEAPEGALATQPPPRAAPADDLLLRQRAAQLWAERADTELDRLAAYRRSQRPAASRPSEPPVASQPSEPPVASQPSPLTPTPVLERNPVLATAPSAPPAERAPAPAREGSIRLLSLADAASSPARSSAPALLWMVQVGSFSQRENAEQLRAQLTGRYAVTVQQANLGGQRLYRVRVGPQTSRRESEQVRRELVRDFALNATVVPLDG